MSSKLNMHSEGGFLQGLRVQSRVIGALFLREMHTRYGRENFGYMWLVFEPMMLASVIGLLHSSERTSYGTDIRALPLAILGYTVFIMFRGIVNRSEGAMEQNMPLLYHRMVSVFDVMFSRAILEAGGTFTTLVVLMALLISAGYADLPVRPLYVIGGIAAMFAISLGHSLIIVSISHDNRTVGRLVHPYTYFNVPLSASFFQVEWIPQPYRDYLLWLPLPNLFEMVRYGWFWSASPNYFSIPYLIGWCLVLNWIGLVCIHRLRTRMHGS